MTPISPPPSPTYPLARAYRLQELPGWIGKSLDVPPASQGVALYGDGQSRLFTPGRRRLLSILNRLAGRGVDLRSGYVPAAPLAVRFQVTNILSGDGALLDASLVCQVEVVDAPRFFTAQVLPRQEIRRADPDLSDQAVAEALHSVTRRYAADDLIQGFPTARLVPEVQAHLDPLLSNQGLRLVALQCLSFWRSEDRAIIAEKAQALRERLQDVELQARMAQIENQAQLDDFTRQMTADLGETGLRPVVTGEAAGKSEQGFHAWIDIATRQEGAGHHWRMEALLHRSAQPGSQEKPAASWWLGRVIWMGVVISLGFIFSQLVAWLTPAMAAEARWPLLIPIWTFVIGDILNDIRVLYLRREAQAEKRWTALGEGHLERLAGADRGRVDQLVRTQCGDDLHHVTEILGEVRTRVYKEGKAELALRIRDGLQTKVDALYKMIQDTNRARPAYLTDLNLGEKLWQAAVEYDEQVLARSARINETAHTLRQNITASQPIVDDLGVLERQVNDLEMIFDGRSRPIKLSGGS